MTETWCTSPSKVLQISSSEQIRLLVTAQTDPEDQLASFA